MAQQKLNNFYNLDNLVKIKIDIPQSTWDTLRKAEPHGSWGFKGNRYDMFKTNSVTISTRAFTNKTFTNVGIVKKSFAGSKDDIKPSFRLSFAEYQKSNEDEIVALIGTKVLVLNNCKQDQQYMRQPLGYSMLRQAGVPSLRCNFATVQINNAQPTVYVNIEAFKKPFLENTFNGNVNGNGYEIELQQDLVETTWTNPQWYGTPSFEGYSKFDDMKDIKLLGKAIESQDWNTVQKVVDMDAFIKFQAMETLLKHWDGFTQKINNTFVYNDTVPVENPTYSNLKFKFVPSGIDQIFCETDDGEQLRKDVRLGNVPQISQLLLRDRTSKNKLCKCMQGYAQGEVFSDDFTSKIINRLVEVLKQTSVLGQPAIDQAANIMRSQVRSVREQGSTLAVRNMVA